MRYRQPRAINVVSVTLLILAGIAVYILVYLWPVYSTASRAKSVLHDFIPALYKANLRPQETARSMIDKVKTDIAAEYKRLGIDDKTTKIIIHRSPKEIGIEAHFKLAAHFPFPDKTYEFNMSPKVTSDATRINW